MFFEHAENEIGAAVVNHAFACNLTFFQSVESRRVVLVGHEHRFFVVGGVNLFGFTLVQKFAFFHVYNSSVKLILEFITPFAFSSR